MSVLFDQADQLREFFFAMLESLPGGLILADRRGGLLALNRRATALLGLSGMSVQGRDCRELLAGSLGLEAATLEALGRPAGRLLVEATPRGEGGEKRLLLLARNELQSPFLGVEGFFLSLEDMTYPAMIEAHLDRRKRLAGIQDMTVSLSQELRNPLGGLELYASMLRRDLGDDPDYQRLTTRMLAAIGTINHLLDNALTFASQPRPEKERFAVDPWLERVLAALAPQGEAAGVRFVPRWEHSNSVLNGDPGLLEQMMFNLGLNALESMAGPGEIELATRTLAAGKDSPPLLAISWRDRGRGIAAEQRERIFDPFYSTKKGGKGLGLAIVHHIVEGHQGFIRVESEPGRGSVFTVLLPL